MTDIDFQIEAYQWVYQIRGHRYMQQVWRSLERLGPTKTAERFIHPEMSKEEKEVYRAAISFMTELAPQVG